METIIVKPNLVKMMRDIRDQFSLDILDMSLEEQRAYIKKQIEELKKKRIKVHNKK
ncbi:MAG: hypothetical protein H6553_12250 [Chitinophagales bacterium]|nr:hypothetical protein [Chitinophagales bacterium]